MRCFVAIEMEPGLRELLVRALPLPPAGECPSGRINDASARMATNQRGVRWCKPQQLHLTLKFLGDVAANALPDVCEVVRVASRALAPFELIAGEIGVFPSARRPRVLWCGLSDPGEGCERWLERAEPGFASLGFPRESRRFQAHITLARSQSAAGARLLSEYVERLKLPAAPAMRVREVVLFESRLLPAGAEYTPLSRASLGSEA